jgi:hypothetical protein
MDTVSPETKNEKRKDQLMDTITTIEAEAFKNSIFFSINIPSMSFRKQIKDQGKLIDYLNQLAAEKAQREASGEAVDLSNVAIVTPSGSIPKIGKNGINATKPLLACPQLDALRKHLSEAKAKITAFPQYGGYANPSGIMEGLFEISKDLAGRLDSDITEANNKLTQSWADADGTEHKGFLTAFLDAYDAAIERARTAPILDGGLGPLFCASDYPSKAEVGSGVEIRRRFLAFGVPEGLPPELKQKAYDELKADLNTARDTIMDSLREGLLGLLAHGQEVLTVKAGEKPKVIKESLLGNVLSFCDMFALRNSQGDTELADLVNQCKAQLAGIKPDECRKFESVRAEAAARFAELSAKVGEMVESKKGRKINLE